MSGLDVSVASRVPQTLRTDLEAIALRRQVDLSTVIRQLLREGADRELAGRPAEQDPRLFYAMSGAAAPSSPKTSHDAAKAVQPRAGTQRALALGCIVRASQGATVDEVEQELERALGRRVPTNGLAKRVSELLHAGAITTTIAVRHGGQQTAAAVLTRQTRSGVQAQVYVATALGQDWHRDLSPRQPEAVDAGATQRHKGGPDVR